MFPETDVPTVAATDYVRALPRMIASWMNGPFTVLGTDGFGMSERRSGCAHFKVDGASIADAARKLTASYIYQWTLSGGAHPVALHLAPPGAIAGTSCPPVEGDNHG